MSESKIEKLPIVPKLVLVGDAESGKSAILNALQLNAVPKDYQATVSAKYVVKTIEVEGTFVKFQIWDIPGQEKFRRDTASYYGGANAIGIVLDGTKPVSEQIGRWVADIRRFEQNQGVPIYFVVNKTDRDNCVSYDEGANAIAAWRRTNPGIKNLDVDGKPTKEIPFFFCSASEDTLVDDAFEGMAAECLIHLRRTQPESFPPEKPKEPVQDGVSQGSGSPSSGNGVLETLEEHRWWVGVNGVLIAAVIVLLILTAVVPPVGAALALGGLSGLAMAGIVGAGAFVLWNGFCAIGNRISKVRHGGGPSGSNFEQDEDGKYPNDIKDERDFNSGNDDRNDNNNANKSSSPTYTPSPISQDKAKTSNSPTTVGQPEVVQRSGGLGMTPRSGTKADE